ncbi:hypothetical protein AGMMS49531_09840 [Endomicrobiia bacterium]|nr:hypothetical protein AGMMS49531_09840 [Endomicrobiia bacterium]
MKRKLVIAIAIFSLVLSSCPSPTPPTIVTPGDTGMNEYIYNLDNLIWRLNAGNARTAFTNALEAIKLCRSINLDRAAVRVRQADDYAREADNARKAAIDLHECDSIILAATVATAAARAAKEYIDTMHCHHYATPTTGRPD